MTSKNPPPCYPYVAIIAVIGLLFMLAIAPI